MVTYAKNATRRKAGRFRLGVGIIKIVRVLVIYLIVVQPASAYVPIEYVDGVRVKYFYDNINKTFCNSLIKKIPDEYFKGIVVINFVKYHRNAAGMYHFGGVIEIYNGCDVQTLVHELAHHRQYMMRDPWYELLHHSGNFDKYENEIYDNIKRKYWMLAWHPY